MGQSREGTLFDQPKSMANRNEGGGSLEGNVVLDVLVQIDVFDEAVRLPVEGMFNLRCVPIVYE